MNNFRFNGYCNIEQGIPGATDKVEEVLEELIDKVDTLSRKGILPEGDIEGLERAAGKAEQFLRPQSEEPAPWVGQLADAPFNGLSPAQAERLDILAEECAEVIQSIMKIKRHGFESCSPYGHSQETNRQALVRELFDVRAAAEMCSIDLPELGLGDEVDVQVAHDADVAVQKALIKKLAYSHHQSEDFGQFMAAVEAL